MSDLDEKLLKVIGANFVQERFYGSTQKAVSQIKQVFTDAGWVQMAYNPSDQTVAGMPVASVLKTDDTFMTGQEFYSAYKRELGFGSLDDVKDMARGDELKAIEVAEMKCDEAAKRAAGLEPGL